MLRFFCMDLNSRSEAETAGGKLNMDDTDYLWSLCLASNFN